MVSNIFSKFEVDLLIESLLMYSEAVIAPTVSKEDFEFVQSATDKLFELTPFTHFSKDEFEIMRSSVQFLIRNVAEPPAGSYKLLQKLDSHCKT